MANIEEHIQRAIEAGKFKDLPGKGKPLPVEDNPFENPDWRLANHMLKSSGYTLPWIEIRGEIEKDSAAARSELQRAWNWRQAALAQGQPYQAVEAEWQRAIQAFFARVQRLNKRIFDYNLQAPSGQLQLRQLQVEREIEQVGQ